MKKVIIVGGLLLLGLLELRSQTMDPGLIAGFGIGLGFSKHAGTYQVDEVIRIREYPGFRAFNLEAKLGWAFTPRFHAYAVGRLSPSNSTISPYRAVYTGGAISYAFGDYLPLYILAGAGRNSAKVERGVKAGHGTLINLGFGKQLSERFFIEANMHFGAMNDAGEIMPNPFDDSEMNAYIMLSYRIF